MVVSLFGMKQHILGCNGQVGKTGGDHGHCLICHLIPSFCFKSFAWAAWQSTFCFLVTKAMPCSKFLGQILLQTISSSNSTLHPLWMRSQWEEVINNLLISQNYFGKWHLGPVISVWIFWKRSHKNWWWLRAISNQKLRLTPSQNFIVFPQSF